MPDIGFIELALIGLIGFLVLGPERLPEFFAQVGKFMRQGRNWMATLKVQLDQEKQQLTKPATEIKENIQASLEEVSDHITPEKKNK